jgi:Leucine-rich repeat (LRR) protein
LHENKINTIMPHELEGIAAAESLDVLNLAINSLEELRENAFSNFVVLNSLDLEGNYISRIHINAFKGIEGSHKLYILCYNNLRIDPRLGFCRIS